MKKLILALLSILLTGVFCSAQDSPNVNAGNSGSTAAESQSSSAQNPGSPGTQDKSGATQGTKVSSSPSPSSGSSAQQQTISGCLSQSRGGYRLTDSRTGTVYELSGNISDLSSHVGHEMQIMGQLSSANGGNKSAIGAPSGKSAGPYSFQVGTARSLADQCGPSSATANGPSL